MSKKILLIFIAGLFTVLSCEKEESRENDWTTIQLVMTEIYYNPDAGPDDTPFEWIELYNAGTSTVYLDGWVIDDVDSTEIVSANIAPSSIGPGATAILYNSLSSASDFKAKWGSGKNLVAVDYWEDMPLGNGSDTISIWTSFENYTGDHQTLANAYLIQDYASTAPWPENTDGASIYISDFAVNRNDGNNWKKSVSGVDGAYTSTTGEFGSPGIVPF